MPTPIDDIRRNGHEGIGKPEPLRHELAGAWSRRIDQEHRLVYVLDEQETAEFSAQYAALLRAAYPARPYGTVFGFLRTFVVAHKR